MKLKCDTHNRRVLSGDHNWLHRTGDMSRCDSKTATLGNNIFTVEQLNTARTFKPVLS